MKNHIIYVLCCRPMKQEYDGEMGILYTLSKIIKLIPFLLIIGGASKQHKNDATEGFHQNTKALGICLAMDCVHSIRGFV